MIKKVRVSAVSYLNAKPFVYGLQHSSVLEQTFLTLDHPGECARKLIAHEVDIGLVPIAMIEQIPNANIISDYCIAADGAVASVLLISPVPLDQVQTIVMDYESRTSVLLAKVLAHFYWKIKPVWFAEKDTFPSEITKSTGCVVIGDRALALRSTSKYVYDLAAEWKNFTGLPFVFACWVANTAIDDDYLFLFNEALKNGFENREYLAKSMVSPHYDARTYFIENIHYKLDETKRRGMEKFLNLSKQM